MQQQQQQQHVYSTFVHMPGACMGCWVRSYGGGALTHKASERNPQAGAAFYIKCVCPGITLDNSLGADNCRKLLCGRSAKLPPVPR